MVKTQAKLIFALILATGVHAEAEPVVSQISAPVSDCHVLVLVAHPDDEIVVAGTLAQLVTLGAKVKVVYATSGELGSDIRHPAESGTKLVASREKESMAALKELGVLEPPVFLHAPDGGTAKTYSLLEQLKAIQAEWRAKILISFGPDGISGHVDHIILGLLAQQLADQSRDVKILLNMAMSNTLAEAFGSSNTHVESKINTVIDEAVSLRVNVKKYRDQKIAAMRAYKSQAISKQVALVKPLLEKYPYEDFVIGRNRLGAEFNDLEKIAQKLQEIKQ